MNIDEVNKWADFWRYQIGVNVIPADAVKRTTYVKWKDDPRGNWQIQPIPKEMHDEWKKTGAFEKGMAVICGKVFHNDAKKNLYLCAVDADNRKAVEEITRNDLAGFAKQTLVEAHANPNKAHFYVYTTKPMPKKSSDATNLDLLRKMENNEIPAIEVKGDGTHGVMFCTPSPHRDGSRYGIIGVTEPAIYDKIGEAINNLCDRFSLGRDDKNMVPMKVLIKDDTRILEGNNRHEGLMRYAESILRKAPFLEKSIFYDIIQAKNNRMCVPPLNDKEVQKQINDAIAFINKQKEDEALAYQQNKNRFGTKEFWEDAEKYRKIVNPTRQYIRCVTCGFDIDDNVLDKKHYGHLVKFK